MSKVSITNLAGFAKRLDAEPLPTDKFSVKLTRSHLQWLQRIVAQQIKSERAQLDHYIKRDAVNHPERKTIDRFRGRLEMAQDFKDTLDKAITV